MRRSSVMDDRGVESFSQFGEDIVGRLVLELHNRLHPGGYYVDVGAHHPVLHSNTFILRQRFGFRGINIDADQDLLREFYAHRPDDVNVCAVISARPEEDAVFTILEQRGMSTASRERVDSVGDVPIIETRIVRVLSLTHVLDEAGSPNDIDFLSIDIEGSDLEALRSLDFDRYRPFCICIEELDFDMHQPERSAIFRYLVDKGYVLFSRAWVSSFYFYPPGSRR